MKLPNKADTEVLIIGGGPVGLTTAILLAKYDIKSIIVERHFERLGQPKAHAINARSLEIFKQAGLDTKALRAAGMKLADGELVRFATSLTGLEFGYLNYERQTPEAEKITPEPLFNISQPLLEEFLCDVINKSDKITFWRGVQFQTSVEIEEGRNSSSILDRATGKTVEVTSTYVLACDGANSRSRAKFGVEFSTFPGHSDGVLHHISVHLVADFRKYKSGTLCFLIGPTQQGTFICYDRAKSWVYVINIDPDVSPPSSFTEKRCREIVDKAIGEKCPYEVLSITHWTTQPKIADAYQSKTNPRVLFVGDAAHVFPPTGGLGVNTGIADAHNLVWKIVAAEKGWTNLKFIDTYEKERKPIAIANGQQSALNQKKLFSLMKLTSDPTLQDLQSAMSNPTSRASILQAIQDNSDHFDSIDLQIGYCYGSATVIDGPCNQFVPSCRPGGRLPHARIIRNNSPCSTLDLVDGHSFVIIASEDFPKDSFASDESNGTAITLALYREGVDFTDVGQGWSEIAQFTSTVAGLLIRPDQHIISRISSVIDARQKLREFLAC